MILIIDNYDSFTYNLFQYVSELGYECEVIRNDKIDIKGIKKLNPESIIISPGPGKPDSSGISKDIVKELTGKIPILGVCLGHQVIGEVFGGKVIKSNKIIHGKTSKIYHNNSSTYSDLPNPFTGVRYHSLIIEKNSLPDCFEITSHTEDGTIMGIKHKEYSLEGIQFHPESIQTENGKSLLKNFIDKNIRKTSSLGSNKNERILK